MDKVQLSCSPCMKGRLGDIYNGINFGLFQRPNLEEARKSTSDADGLINLVAVENVNLSCYDDSQRNEVVDALQKDMKVASDLTHTNTLKYRGISITQDKIYVISDCIPGGTLANLIRNFGPLNCKIVARYAYSIASGLEKLHEKGIVHGMISSSCIFVGDHGVLKVGSYYPFLPTLRRISEIEKNNLPSRKYSIRTRDIADDIRDFAILIVEMLTGNRMRTNNTLPTFIMNNVTSNTVEYSFLMACFKITEDTVSFGSSVNLNVFSDLGINSLFNHLYFREFNGKPNDPKKELSQIIKSRKAVVRQVHEWNKRFFERENRSPCKSDRSPEIVKLLIRSKTLRNSIKELQKQVEAQEVDANCVEIDRNSATDVCTTKESTKHSTPTPEKKNKPASPGSSTSSLKKKSQLQIVTQSPTDQMKSFSNLNMNRSIRSPAQNAFIARFKVPESKSDR